MHVDERKDYHLIDDLWFSYKILKIPNFSYHHHFRHLFQSGPDFSETNNDADLIPITVCLQMIGFSNMANLFDLDGGTYSYLDLKNVIPIKF